MGVCGILVGKNTGMAEGGVIMNTGLPYYYTDLNVIGSSMIPSTLHANNTVLTQFFARYLLMEIFSIFKFKLLPNWAKNYFLYTLFGFGYLAVVQTRQFGVICQQAGLRGYDVYYQPTNAIIVNPCLTGILEPRIGQQCTIVKIKDDYGGIMDLVNYYANEMAIASEVYEVNMWNSRLAYMFAAKNKAGAEGLKKAFDQIMTGNTAVFYDDKLKIDRGSGQREEPWTAFANNLKNNFIAPELLDVLRRLKELFCTDMGIGSVRSDKKERMITAEAESTQRETESKVEVMLENIKEGFEQANRMFGIDLSVELRFKGGEGIGSVPNVERFNGV